MDPTSQRLFYEFGSHPKPPRYFLLPTKEEVEAAFQEDVARLRSVRNRALDALKGRPLGRVRKAWLTSKLEALIPGNQAQSASIRVILDNLDRYHDVFTIFGTLDLLYVDGIDDLRTQYSDYCKPKVKAAVVEAEDAAQDPAEDAAIDPFDAVYHAYSPSSPAYSPASPAYSPRSPPSPPLPRGQKRNSDVEFVSEETQEERLEKLRKKAEDDGAIVEVE